jgi:hypothetical protein
MQRLVIVVYFVVMKLFPVLPFRKVAFVVNKLINIASCLF